MLAGLQQLAEVILRPQPSGVWGQRSEATNVISLRSRPGLRLTRGSLVLKVSGIPEQKPGLSCLSSEVLPWAHTACSFSGQMTARLEKKEGIAWFVPSQGV